MKYYNDIGQLVGRTPLVRINRMNPFPEIILLAKLEKYNPAGSVKDRIAKQMIETAEQTGLLTPDKTVIEATSGNTGIGIAMICALKGYQCELVMPESMSVERRMIMRAYGATVTLTSGDLGMNGAQDYVSYIVSEYPEKYHHLDQFSNPANWQAHYETTAMEILDDTDRTITHFVAGLGTSGTLMGVSKRLREELEEITIVSVEPDSESYIQGLKNLERSYVPEIFDELLIDQRIQVTDSDSTRIARDMGREEGLFIGQSSGAAIQGAIQLIGELHRNGQHDSVVVVILPDSGEKYISSGLFQATQKAKALSSSIVH